MEPGMVVDMLKTAEACGAKVKAIIGDEDFTTIARARKEVDATLEKHSDMNHLKKRLGNALYNLKNSKKYRNLTPKVIKYLQKMYSYAIRQNRGNPEKLGNALASTIPHVFGVHEKCEEDWCGYTREPTNYSFISLPYGKPLSGEALKADLTDIFDKSVKQADQLSHTGSSQANESLNMTVTSKAPKNKYFSESKELGCRIQAAVAQKNISYSYVAVVKAFS